MRTLSRYKKEKLNKAFLTFKYNDSKLMEMFNISLKELKEYELLPSFRSRIRNWVEEKRCINCNIWRIKELYPKSWKNRNWTIAYKSNCSDCNNLKYRNKRKLATKEEKEKLKLRNEKCRKNKWEWYFYKQKKARIIARWERDLFLRKERILQKKIRIKKSQERLTLLLKEKRLWNLI